MTDPALFSIHPGGSEPIYRQLMAQVRRCVAGGQLRAGDELPSVRELAQALAVNPMTISKAFSLLEAEGLLERRRGLGMVVAQAPAPQPDQRLALLAPALQAAARQARELGVGSDEAVALFKHCLADLPLAE